MLKNTINLSNVSKPTITSLNLMINIYKPISILESCLEIGKDAGVVALSLAEEGFDVVGVDLSESIKEVGDKSYLKGIVNWVEDSLPYLPNTLKLDKKFHTIIFKNFEDTPESVSSLKSLKSILKNKGVIILSFRDLYSEKTSSVEAILKSADEAGLTLVDVAPPFEESIQGITWTVNCLILGH